MLWPKGFELGSVVRIRGQEWTEGRITRRDRPEHESDEPLVQITAWGGSRIYATIAAVEAKGIDYNRPLLSYEEHRRFRRTRTGGAR